MLKRSVGLTLRVDVEMLAEVISAGGPLDAAIGVDAALYMATKWVEPTSLVSAHTKFAPDM
jgi:hypothetical protein